MSCEKAENQAQNSFENILNCVDSCEDIESLFALWEKAHMAEENYEETTVTVGKTKNTKRKQKELLEKGIKYKIENNEILIDGIEQDSFVKDGYVNKSKYDNADIKVLFILKEANIMFYRGDENTSIPDHQIKLYNGETDTKPKQFEKIGRMACFLQKRAVDGDKARMPSNEEIRDARCSCAFMNLNKRGGGSSANDDKIKAYVYKYVKFIRRQIELINPDCIVVVGDSNISKINIEKYIRMWHTSYGMQNKKRESNADYGTDVNVDCYMREFFDRV